MIVKKSISPLSASTNPMVKCKTKSLIIRQCKCGVRFEVTQEFQSFLQCPDCRKPKMCIHNVATTERCAQCHAKHGNYFIRTM